MNTHRGFYLKVIHRGNMLYSKKYIVYNCPSCNNFDVFGCNNNGCCYKYHDYCINIDDCIVKQVINYSNNEKINQMLGVDIIDT